MATSSARWKAAPWPNSPLRGAGRRGGLCVASDGSPPRPPSMARAAAEQGCRPQLLPGFCPASPHPAAPLQAVIGADVLRHLLERHRAAHLDRQHLRRAGERGGAIEPSCQPGLPAGHGTHRLPSSLPSSLPRHPPSLVPAGPHLCQAERERLDVGAGVVQAVQMAHGSPQPGGAVKALPAGGGHAQDGWLIGLRGMQAVSADCGLGEACRHTSLIPAPARPCGAHFSGLPEPSARSFTSCACEGSDSRRLPLWLTRMLLELRRGKAGPCGGERRLQEVRCGAVGERRPLGAWD